MPITIFNIFLCGLVVFWGITVFVCKKKQIGLLIAIAFLLFGISHLLTIAHVNDNITGFVFLVVIRSIAYLVIIIGLDKLLRKK
jgi:NADH:ubiquinone oxidoreductase subunit K